MATSALDEPTGVAPTTSFSHFAVFRARQDDGQGQIYGDEKEPIFTSCGGTAASLRTTKAGAGQCAGLSAPHMAWRCVRCLLILILTDALPRERNVATDPQSGSGEPSAEERSIRMCKRTAERVAPAPTLAQTYANMHGVAAARRTLLLATPNCGRRTRRSSTERTSCTTALGRLLLMRMLNVHQHKTKEVCKCRTGPRACQHTPARLRTRTYNTVVTRQVEKNTGDRVYIHPNSAPASSQVFALDCTLLPRPPRPPAVYMGRHTIPGMRHSHTSTRGHREIEYAHLEASSINQDLIKPPVVTKTAPGATLSADGAAQPPTSRPTNQPSPASVLSVHDPIRQQSRRQVKSVTSLTSTEAGDSKPQMVP